MPPQGSDDNDGNLSRNDDLWREIKEEIIQINDHTGQGYGCNDDGRSVGEKMMKKVIPYDLTVLARSPEKN